MGLDFLRKAAPTYRKSLDLRRVELATPTLFMKESTTAPRTYAANLCDGQEVSVEEELGVRLESDQIVVRRGLDIVGTINNPSSELMDALKASHGEALGLVRVVHDDARIAEIVVC